ncbi:MAG: hypothetical protein ACOYM3_01045 [Terrimicrobiaceae bacterium]
MSYTPSSAYMALRDFETWAGKINDPDLAAFARQCAQDLRKQGVLSAPAEAAPPAPRPTRVSNRIGKTNTGYKGVARRVRRNCVRYEAQLHIDGRNRRVSFRSIEDAIRYYDHWAWNTFHDLSRLNHPEEILDKKAQP